MLTIKKIIEDHLLDDYMPDCHSPKTKQIKILGWIRSGELLVARGAKHKKRLVPEEAIQVFKDRIAMTIENLIK